MNTANLLREIARVRPAAGNLIQTILEVGAVAGSVNLGIVDENGVPTLSLHTIVRAMGVLDDFSKTKDFGATVGSKEIHAYGVVERAISEQHTVSRQLRALQSGLPADFNGLAKDLGGGFHGDPDDFGSGDQGECD